MFAFKRFAANVLTRQIKRQPKRSIKILMENTESCVNQNDVCDTQDSSVFAKFYFIFRSIHRNCEVINILILVLHSKHSDNKKKFLFIQNVYSLNVCAVASFNINDQTCGNLANLFEIFWIESSIDFYLK